MIFLLMIMIYSIEFTISQREFNHYIKEDKSKLAKEQLAVLKRTDKFKKDMDSKLITDHVQSDMAEGNSAGVDKTPTFFINGKIVNVNTMDEFKQLLLSLK